MKSRVICAGKCDVSSLIRFTAAALGDSLGEIPSTSCAFDYVFCFSSILSSLEEFQSEVAKFSGNIMKVELCIFLGDHETVDEKYSLLLKVFHKVTIMRPYILADMGCGCRVGICSAPPLVMGMVVPSDACTGILSKPHEIYEIFKQPLDILYSPNAPVNLKKCHLVTSSRNCVDQLEGLISPRFTISTAVTSFYFSEFPRSSSPLTTFIGLETVCDEARKALFAMEVPNASTLKDNLLVFPKPPPLISSPQAGDRKRLPELSTECNIGEKTPKLYQPLEPEIISSNTVVASNLPFGLDDSDIRNTFDMFGPIGRIGFSGTRFKRSRCFVTFQDVADASRLISREPLEIRGRAVHIKFSREQPQLSSDALPPVPPLDLRPHFQCWFCLANPQCERRLVVAVHDNHYVALAKGGIDTSHFLITPIGHYPALAFCPKALTDSLYTGIEDVKTFLFANGYTRICLWERYYPMKTSHAMHMQIQVIGLKYGAVEDFDDAMQNWEERNQIQFERLPQTSSFMNIRERVGDMQDSYTYLEYSSKEQRNTYIYANNKSKLNNAPRMPINIGREVLCQMYDMPNRENWKMCLLQPDEADSIADKWRTAMIEFKQQTAH